MMKLVTLYPHQFEMIRNSIGNEGKTFLLLIDDAWLSRKLVLEIIGELEDTKPELVGNAIDIEIISSEKGRIHIDDIRNIRIFLKSYPMQWKHKYAVIFGAEQITREGANSFLKITEEPEKFNIIMMTTSNIDAVLPTIRSRAIRISFPRPSSEAIQKVSSPLHAPELIALFTEIAGYDMQIFEAIENIDDMKTVYEDVKVMLNGEKDIIDEFVNSISEGGWKGCIIRHMLCKVLLSRLYRGTLSSNLGIMESLLKKMGSERENAIRMLSFLCKRLIVEILHKITSAGLILTEKQVKAVSYITELANWHSVPFSLTLAYDRFAIALEELKDIMAGKGK